MPASVALKMMEGQRFCVADQGVTRGRIPPASSHPESIRHGGLGLSGECRGFLVQLDMPVRLNSGREPTVAF